MPHIVYISVSQSVHLCTVVCIEIILLCSEILISIKDAFEIGINYILIYVQKLFLTAPNKF